MLHGATMKNTSITLSEHFNNFIGEQVESGRFQSTSEVVRAALRLLEEDTKQLETLRKLISVGEQQADNGEFVDYPLTAAIADIENDEL